MRFLLLCPVLFGLAVTPIGSADSLVVDLFRPSTELFFPDSQPRLQLEGSPQTYTDSRKHALFGEQGICLSLGMHCHFPDILTSSLRKTEVAVSSELFYDQDSQRHVHRVRYVNTGVIVD